LLDSGCSSILIDSSLLANHLAINKLDIVTDDSLSLQGALKDMATDIRGYFYGYLILYDVKGNPFPIASKIYIAQGLSYPIFAGLNILKDDRFKAILPDTLVLSDYTSFDRFGNPLERKFNLHSQPKLIQSTTLKSAQAFVLRAQTQSLVPTDFISHDQNYPFQLAITHDETLQQDYSITAYNGTYKMPPTNEPLHILLSNYTDNDVYISAHTPIAQLHPIPVTAPKANLILTIDHKDNTIKVDLSSSPIRSNVLHHYPSFEDNPSKHQKRTMEIMDEINSQGYSQFSVSDVYQDFEQTRSYDVPLKQTKQKATPQEIFDLMPKDHLTPTQQAALKTLVFHYRDVFAKDITELNKTHLVELSAELRPNTDLSRYALKLRDVPINYREKLDTMLQQMLNSGLIRPAKGVIRLISPVRLIPKPKSDKMRLINDVRITNAVCQKSTDPGNETIMASLSKLRNISLISSLDLSSSFWQIPVDEFLKSLLSFYGANRKLYQFQVCPMGFINSMSALQAAANRMHDIPVFKAELKFPHPLHAYNLAPTLTHSQITEVLQPVQTQIIGKLQSEHYEPTPRKDVFHTKLNRQQLRQTQPVSFLSDSVFNMYADDISLGSTNNKNCCFDPKLSPLYPTQNSLMPNQPIAGTTDFPSDDLFFHHLAELEILFIKMRKANLSFSPQKSFIASKTISLLGYRWSMDKISIDDLRLQGFKDLKTPNF